MAGLDERQATEIETLIGDRKELVVLLHEVVARAEKLLARLEEARDETERAEIRHALKGLIATYGGRPLVEDVKEPALLRARLAAFVAAWQERLDARITRKT